VEVPSAIEIAIGIVMVVGLAGTVAPFLPGLPLIWAAAVVYGLVEGFGAAGITAMTAITVLLAGGVAAKFVLARRRAVASGASRSTLVAGALAGIVGFFVVPVIGFFIGGILGILLAERRRLGDATRAWSSTRAVIAAFGVGVLLEMAAGAGMIGAWALWVGAQG
jgi:uncharacterized protein YqgC (DUF456 family)